ncbi:MAG TPA: hypothetical protein DIW81_26520 [Planctomycetaceae bacterium]|nr:hypothetical protein [Rubinisphaera sp.]HCS55096.1 hypothetical protein [Planctomycetaceae bacterium]
MDSSQLNPLFFGRLAISSWTGLGITCILVGDSQGVHLHFRETHSFLRARKICSILIGRILKANDVDCSS